MSPLYQLMISNETTVKPTHRGLLIALEGGDRCGKSTQCTLVLEYLAKVLNQPTHFIKFPERTSAIGRVINEYLQCGNELSNQVIHLLFSANRWEFKETLEKMLNEGTTIVMDRYAYSGVAYSAAKGLSLDWCKSPDHGLPEPDLVLFIDLPPEVAAARAGYGEERYEKLDFQVKVRKMFDQLCNPETWKMVNGNQSIEGMFEEIKDRIDQAYKILESNPNEPTSKASAYHYSTISSVSCVGPGARKFKFTQMKAKAFQIHWHNKQPIYSVDFHPTNSNKLATCGGDNNVRIWNVVNANENSSEEAATILLGSGLRVEYLATLTKHMKSVNCVRFSPSGDFLASAGDGGFVILWKQSDVAPLQFNKAFGDDSEDEDDTDRKEFWSVSHQFRAMDGEDIYDLAWSPDGKYLILGLTDNTAQIWDTQSAKCVKVLKDHQHFVQGVAWDPFDQFLVTQSSDRSVKLWTMRNGSKGINYYSLSKYSKITTEETAENSTSYSIFHDETLVSFFRRPSFSPDGSLLCLPTGQRTPLTPKNTPHGIYLNLRNNLHKPPTAFIGGFEKAAIAIRFNPRLFPLIQDGGGDSVVPLNYRMIFAVVTQNSVYIFDTQNKAPLFVFSNLHYASLTDVTWSCDGAKLVASSVDGFCTVAEFEPKNDFGGEAMSFEDSDKILKEISCYVKSIPFFNPPPPLPVNVKKQVNTILEQDIPVISSEIDILIEIEDEDMEPSVEEVRNDHESENSTFINNEINTENFNKSLQQTQQQPIIHNPPVKRRIAPTLLSKE